ncbi:MULTISPECIES: Gfo/Idh/MocA family protein [unclassified Microbacterium]|uniref:Gfo/Idh/MocA family protein n=1 Tax=unclassified Microbacterium TaxID=2609290 RepID=UPI00160526A1|nr:MULTISPECIES: Gfo/Idh/MocA family oxidoreductase [unclassified Microbacterium]QNA93973.1 Gfo/Idh/MocA family oxidoreductase [Microbacterium sp. Se63.02b]QYM64297.1 Gfo/Idh/MocA family oxidoreductase [Microbacterium sp. Se5.02b]
MTARSEGSPVRVGFVGTGVMGQMAHLANYARLGTAVELVAVAEPRRELGAAVARRYGFARAYTSADEMLEHEDLDALVAPQPFTRHLQILGPLYAAGLPIFSEKPLASSTALGVELLRLLDASPTPFHMVGYHKRSDPATQRARALIAGLLSSGEWGALRYARLTIPGGNWAVDAVDDVIFSDEEVPLLGPDGEVDSAFETFVNFYSHQTNLLRHLLGESYAVKYADPSGRLMVAETASGVPVALEMEPWRREQGWEEYVIIGFDRGYIRVDYPAPLAARKAGKLTLYSEQGDEGELRELELPPVHAMLSQARGFVEAVRTRTEPVSEAHDALEDLRIADEYLAAVRGARS